MLNLIKKDFIINIIAVVILMLYPYTTYLFNLEPESRWLPFILIVITGATFYLPKHCEKMQIINK